MRLVVDSMSVDDIPEVLEVDRESYTLPWPATAYRREITHNRNARYFVLRQVDAAGDAAKIEPVDPRPKFPFGFFRRPLREEDGSTPRNGIVGYAGMWLMVDEAHITTIAVREAWRGKKLGELLLASLIEAAADASVDRVTLEVRVSNEVAQALYTKYGFQREGVRPRYYSDNNEDAFIMTTGSIHEEEYQRRFDELIVKLNDSLGNDAHIQVAAPSIRTVQDGK